METRLREIKGQRELRPCIVIDIDGDNYRICDQASKQFWGNSKKGRYGRGLMRSNDDPYCTARIGYLGRMALQLLTGLKSNFSYKAKGDADQRFKLSDGRTIKVTCAMTERPWWYIRAIDEKGNVIELDADIYVFAYVESENRARNRATVVLCGYVDKQEVKKSDLVKGKRGSSHFNYEVKEESIHPMEKWTRENQPSSPPCRA